MPPSLLIFLPLHHNGIGIIVEKMIDFYDLALIYVLNHRKTPPLYQVYFL